MSRLSSIRDAIKGAAPALKTGLAGGLAAGAVATGLGLYSGKDSNQSLEIGKQAAFGASVGMAAGAAAGLIGAAPRLAKAGFSGGVGNMSRLANRASGLLKPSMAKVVAGGILGAAAAGGYAVLKSNKPVSFNDRLDFETKRKQMTVDANVNQMKRMREVMNDTRMR